jgi:hypothetical protein
MESMKAHFTAYQLTYWCPECGDSLERVRHQHTRHGRQGGREISVGA